MADQKYVYLLDEGRSELKKLLGLKGANLAAMAGIGLPVPPGLIVTTEACLDYHAGGGRWPAGFEEQLGKALQAIEAKTGKGFGRIENPLLFSVRSSTPVFMPGITDTLLNLGLNEKLAAGLAAGPGGRHFALDCLIRFLYMFSEAVLGLDLRSFDDALRSRWEKNRGAASLPTGDLEELALAFEQIIASQSGKPFPQDPLDQLFAAIGAVFDSWDGRRARLYRKLNKIPDHWGAAVIIQAMVFGNQGPDSGSGVAFTRNPTSGANELYGEFIVNSQGDDAATGDNTSIPLESLKTSMPGVYRQFLEAAAALEGHYLNMLHLNFVIQSGRLYILNTRAGKRTILAAVKIAADLAESGLISHEEAVMRVDCAQVDQLLHRRVKPSHRLKVIALGLAASPGAASGRVFFDAAEAERISLQGERVILVRTETMPDDLNGIIASGGVVTSRGGMASHAAVIARSMGKPCVCGCEALAVDYGAQQFSVGRLTVKKGEYISIDGATGQVILGEAPIVDPELSEEFSHLLDWADQIRTLEVRANADTPRDAEKAAKFGARGVGLARTENMFIARDRLPLVREMILASTPAERAAALEKLLPVQREDFYQIFRAMEGFPVTIRLLDPPLHEFLPSSEELAVEVARLKIAGSPEGDLKGREELLRKVRSLSEFNPMLGHRGCRLGISHPEIYAMQVRAIFEACARLTAEGCSVLPEVEIPLVMEARELDYLKGLVDQVAGEVQAEAGVSFRYLIGTMIELPRAALLADDLAARSDFFSFGTNDLTQTTLGFSRDDAEGKFMQHYLDKKIFAHNPFEVLDRKGVGKLMEMAVQLGRQVRPGLIVGICGEHGGDPRSIEFSQQIGLDYVSCSPYRVPKARLAAAQAAIRHQQQKLPGPGLELED